MGLRLHMTTRLWLAIGVVLVLLIAVFAYQVYADRRDGLW